MGIGATGRGDGDDTGKSRRGDAARHGGSPQGNRGPAPGRAEGPAGGPVAGPSPAGRATPSRRRGDRPRRSLAFKVTAWISGVVAVVLVGGALFGYVAYRNIWGGIRHDVVTGLGTRPPKYNNALNILVFGSDSRVGLTLHEQEKLHVGRSGCGCSDTIMLVHLSPGRHRVTVLNIPRDTMVPMYGCPSANGDPGEENDPSAVVQINQTLAEGGPSCLWKTVEHLTGIHIDHFIQVEFTGVVKVVNDIGGVDVCVPEDISDPDSGLSITAGEHHIDGLTFLEFWRARYTIAGGTDLKRIDRDDLLLAEMLRGILRSGLLSSPTKLLPVADDAVHAIYATDAGLTQSDMLSIVASFRGLSSNDVQFIEAQTQPYPPAPAQVELVQPTDSKLFSAIAHDTTLPGKSRAGSDRGVLDTISPADVHVEVLNGSTTANLAADTATSLTARGFHVAGTGDAPSSDYTSSVIEYSSAADLPAARTLAAQLSHVTLTKDPSVTTGTVELILGSTFTVLSASPSPSASSSAGSSVGGLAKNYGGITGNATCRTDSGAFAP